ncbi:MAG TPA: hypothetical protein VHL77_03445, partial [Ferruginibacter sp.]|nr:hypothetical protein [Ferruginibacter sp.]
MRLLISLAIFFLPVFLPAQQLPLETYTPANGLVDARVIKVFQDSKGRIYFLTREGFSIFDGQRFSNYGNESNKRTEIINGISEYKDGTVKLFSFDGNIYNVKGNDVSIDSSRRKLLTEVNIMVDIDPGVKIIATNYQLLKEENNLIEQIPIPYRFSIAPRIENLFWSDPYLVILRTLPLGGNVLYLYNYRTRAIADTLLVNPVAMSVADKKADIFLYTKNWMQLDHEALQQGKLRLINAYFTPFIPASFIAPALSFDNNNDIWFSDSEQGYCMVSSDTKTQTFYSRAEGFLSGARFVFQDAENNYWFISSANGIQKMQQSPLALISHFNKIPTGYVNTINADEKGNSFAYSSNGSFLNNEKIAAYDPSVEFKPFYYNGQYWKFPDNKTLVGSKGTRFNLAAYVDGDLHDFMPSFASIDREGRLILAGNIMLTIDKNLRLNAYRLPYFCDNIITDD